MPYAIYVFLSTVENPLKWRKVQHFTHLSLLLALTHLIELFYYWWNVVETWYNSVNVVKNIRALVRRPVNRGCWFFFFFFFSFSLIKRKLVDWCVICLEVINAALLFRNIDSRQGHARLSAHPRSLLALLFNLSHSFNYEAFHVDSSWHARLYLTSALRVTRGEQVWNEQVSLKIQSTI